MKSSQVEHTREECTAHRACTRATCSVLQLPGIACMCYRKQWWGTETATGASKQLAEWSFPPIHLLLISMHVHVVHAHVHGEGSFPIVSVWIVYIPSSAEGHTLQSA